MHTERKLDSDLYYIGGNDRRLALFEGVYSIPDGVSYNSYLLMDEKITILDTVDKAVSKVFFENIAYLVDKKKIDYVIINHMEPDHSATLEELILRYPDVKVVCNKKIEAMIHQFFPLLKANFHIVNEGDKLCTGKHTLTFVNTPMVHWPEVMMTYDITSETLFSADAFGSFKALQGALYVDEIDFESEYLSEARRYYTNIVGKYGDQVQVALKKASTLSIKRICPLHGLIYRNNIFKILSYYNLWSGYIPEVEGVLIIYASIYGNNENVAEILANRLNELGRKTRIYDVSVTPSSVIISEAFKYSHLIFISSTYNAGIFITMEDVIRDLVAHNIQNRTIGFIENGSWAPTAYNLMKEQFAKCKNITYIDKKVSVKSSLNEMSLSEVNEFALEVDNSMSKKIDKENVDKTELDNDAFFKLSYGLFVLSSRYQEKDNACIVNTVQLLTDNPKRILVSVNKMNYTHELIDKSNSFAVSILSTKCGFDIFKRFGFASGRTVNKFIDLEVGRTNSNLAYIPHVSNAYLQGRVIGKHDYETHTIFVGEVVEAKVLNNDSSMTYQYYFDNVKPKPVATEVKKGGYVCEICGYVYEGDELSDDFICPLCKHGSDAFKKI